MCTMTWFLNQDGYQLFFNRDEQITRSRALPPSIQEHRSAAGSLRYISPTDADAGGTWIATNELGITVCLLNHYQFQQISTYKNWTSRGEIVRQFSSFTDLVQAQKKFSRMGLDDYRAFRMFMIEPSGANRLLVWDGHSARVEKDVSAPKSSSAVDAQHVKSLRKQLFVDMQLSNSKDPQAYIDYHTSHSPSKSKESVCMHRADAQTVSLCHVSVDATAVVYRYADGSPCEVEFSSPLRMPLGHLESAMRIAAL